MTTKERKAITWMLRHLFSRMPTKVEIEYYYDTDKPKQEKFFSLEEKKQYKPDAYTTYLQRIKKEKREARWIKIFDKKSKKIRPVYVLYKDNSYRFYKNQEKLREIILYHEKRLTDIPSSMKMLFTKYKIHDII